jgi:TrmH family RNA methyltransferase
MMYRPGDAKHAADPCSGSALGRQITSRDNPTFKQIAGIASSARERRKAGASFIEGIHLCQAYLQRHGRPLVVVHTHGASADPDARRWALVDAPQRYALSEAMFREISQVENGVGLAYVIETPSPMLSQRIEGDAVYLDRIQDPGNVGALLRACAAAGVACVITAPGTASCWSPKVLRAGMGAHFALHIHEGIPFATLMPRLSMPVFVTLADAAESLYRADLTSPCLWVFGNEGSGVSDEIVAAAQRRIRIPQAPLVESLNVANAGALCLFEQRRQRGWLD